MATLTFKGGIHPKDGKSLSKDSAIEDLLPGKELVFPLQQHIGGAAIPVVQVGDRVLQGQLIGKKNGFISANIHASVSGIVTKIEKRLVATGGMSESIVIENDDSYTKAPPLHSFIPEQMNPKEILQVIEDAGLVGMGGAGFPTNVKLSPKNPDAIDAIIINGAECEPYLTSDYRRMLERSDAIILGIQTILKLFPHATAFLSIEDNKPDAIEKLTQMVKDVPRIQVKSLKTKYPQGGERSMIYAVTGRKINSKMLPADVGCIVLNIDSIVGIYQAIYEKMPLINRIVTVTGDAIVSPKNFRTYVGTDFKVLIEAAGGFVQDPAKIITGGPMMGFSFFQSDVPVTKGTASILAFLEDEVSTSPVAPCIRCGRCVKACPEHLLPIKLSVHGEHGEKDAFLRLNGMECMECGCCSYVCPAKRPLTQSIRSMKKLIIADSRKN